MHWELTVRDRSGTEHDLAVDAPGSAVVGEVLAAIGGGLDGNVGWALDGKPLAPDGLLTHSGMRTGAVLHPAPLAPAAPDPGRRARRRIEVVGGPDTGVGADLPAGELIVGRGHEAGLVLTDPSASRQHVRIEVRGHRTVVQDAGATLPARLDGIPVGPDEVEWPTHALLRVGDSHLALLPRPPVASGPRGEAAKPEKADGPLEVPAADVRTPVPWSGVLGGAAGGAALAAAFGSPQLLVFAVVSPACLLLTTLGQRIGQRRGRRARRRATAAAQAVADEQRATAVQLELRQRRAAAPDAADLVELAFAGPLRCWDRSRDDPNLLTVRLGLATAGTLEGVPALHDLASGSLLVDAPRNLALGVGRAMVTSLAVSVSPADLAVGVVCARPDEPGWRWARWLPQLIGPPATTSAETRRLERELAAAVSGGRRAVVLVDGTGAEPPPPPRLPAGSAVVRLGPRGPDIGRVDAVLRATGCGVRAQYGDVTVLAEPVSTEWAERVARALAGADVSADPSHLPGRCTLRQVHGPWDAGSVAARWDAVGDRALAVLGSGTDGTVAIDLVRDGPHALIAGTTGAGKSRLLRALVAGLAVDQPPDRLALLLIDFKGGAAFAECVDLPHVAGLVTDLDPALTSRALASLRAELRRRERAFAAAGVPDLPAYVACGATPAVPRLIVVVDEFATLVEDLPEFAAGLTTIAQRGRSLGLHLVLATQRPAGSVSADVRANCSLRIALRTTDDADSSDLLGVPDAARIPAERPGRGFVWNAGILRPVQVADTDAPDDPALAVRVTPLDHWRRPVAPAASMTAGPTQLRSLTDAVCAAAARGGRPRADPPWCPPLPDDLPIAAMPAPSAADQVALGLVDLPAEQRQAPLRLDLAEGGALLVVGAARSGRTSALTALATAAAGSDAGDLDLHVLDLAGDLANSLRGLPGLGTVVGPTDGIELAADLVAQLSTAAQQRRRQIERPAERLILLVDGWPQLVRASDDYDGGRTVDQLLSLARDAAGGQLTVAVAGDRSALAARVATSFGVRLVLRLGDRADYGLAGISPAAVPRSMPPGRAILAPDGAGCDALQVQLGRPDHAVLPARHRRRTSVALRVRALPSKVPLAGLDRVDGGLAFAVAAPLDLPVVLPLAGTGPVLVAGPLRSGRTTALVVLLLQAVRHEPPVRVVVAAPRRSALRSTAEQAGVTCIDPDDRPENGADPAEAADSARLVLVDDADAFIDTPAEEALVARARAAEPGRPLVAAVRTSELSGAFRGLGAELRRFRTGLLLQPERGDGDLLGVRLPALARDLPPGRGCLVGAPGWSTATPAAGVLRVQVAVP